MLARIGPCDVCSRAPAPLLIDTRGCRGIRHRNRWFGPLGYGSSALIVKFGIGCPDLLQIESVAVGQTTGVIR